MSFLPNDKIRVFVSSRLGECLEERIIAKAAIKSLNHQPIMFEAAGSRPWPPRSVYLNGLENSVFFIGIYKEGYGYIADGMNISGLEDEYRYSANLGLPQLIYVKKECAREERLERLISEFYDSSNTISFYDDSSELEGKIRDDLTSLVSHYVYSGKLTYQLEYKEPREILKALLPAESFVRREYIEDEIEKLLPNSPIVVSGPVGIGKTVILAELSARNNWVFVQCTDRKASEVIIEVTNRLRKILGIDMKAFVGVDDAIASLKASWNALDKVTLVLDDVSSIDNIEHILASITASKTHRVLLSARSPHDLTYDEYTLPPLQRSEIENFISKNREISVTSDETDLLVDASRGNPLYLRYYSRSKPLKIQKDLLSFEVGFYEQLPPRAREAISYIALAKKPLDLQDLLSLMVTQDGHIEEIAECITSAGNLLVDSSRGYSLFHLHAKETIVSIISKSPQKLGFYSQRLSKYLVSKHDYTSAYYVLDFAGLEVSNDLLEHTARHAYFHGDVATAISVLRRKEAFLRLKDDTIGLSYLLVALAQMLTHSGDVDQALKTIEEARQLDSEDKPHLMIEEASLSILAWAKGDVDAITKLEEAKESYLQNNEIWDAARLMIDLSAAYIHRSDFLAAYDEAEQAVKIFSEVGDEYGERVSKLNLLSSASALPDKKDVAKEIMEELEGGEIPLRQRAGLANILGRYARNSGDVEGAKKYALEAIEIGNTLGDVGVICTNTMNLGNAYREEGDLDKAFDCYTKSEKLSNEAGIITNEAKCNELIASIYILKNDPGKAIQHATYSISLVKNGISRIIELDSYEELAQAYKMEGDVASASDAWLQTVRLAKQIGGMDEYAQDSFLRSSRLLYKNNEAKKYLDSYRDVFQYCVPPSSGDLFYKESLAAEVVFLLNCFSEDRIFEASVYHSRMLFHQMPNVLARRIYQYLIEKLLEGYQADYGLTKLLWVIVGVSMSLPKECFSTNDVIRISEQLSGLIPSFSYRAHSDGALHFTIEIDLGRPIIITLSQIDDRDDVSLITFCLSLALKAYSNAVFTDLLAGSTPPRNEVNIQVVNYDEIKLNVPLDKVGIDEMYATSLVTRSVDPVDDSGVPILVITRDDLTKDWLVGTGQGNSGQILFSQVIVEMLFHLFAGELDLESLHPKVINLIKKSIV